jgi:murein biosynthesis integral membrane protein MurJ
VTAPPAAGTRAGTEDAPRPPGSADAAGPAAPAGSGRPAGSDKSLLRHSGVMAAGTLASRFTGFIRTAVLLYALGTRDLGDAYNVANTVPNAVYNLALGGILTSVAVPLIVSAAKRHADRGEAYDQRIFTLGVLVLGAVTLLATAAAVPITAVYGHGMPNAPTYHLTVLFSFFFLPQIFFYGVSSLAGAILNARGSFAAPMWTPIVNNVVVVLAALGFMLVAGLDRTPQDISTGQIELLGIGTTVGIIAQTAALIPALRKAGFRWRPRFDFRRAEVSELGRMSGWMLGYIVTTQISFLVTTIVSNDAGARVCATCAGAGFAAFSNAWQLFQLPYAIVGMSVITAMLPRMSAHAAEGANELVTNDYSAATRLASVIIVPSALILAVLGPALAQGVFGHGSTSAASARYLGLVFAVFSLGLLPYTIFNLQMRVFYAMHDNRTPALIGGVAMAVRIASSLAALAFLPPRDVVAGLGVGFGLSNLVTAMALGHVLRKRIGGLDGRRIRSSMLRMHVAAVPGVLVALAVALGISAVTADGTVASLATVALGGAGGLLAYVLAARLLKIRELSELTTMLRGRLPGRLPGRAS